MFTKLVTAFAGLTLCAASSGCVIEGRDPQPSPSYGTLTTFWTLDSSTDPDVCRYYAVDRIHVVVLDDTEISVDALPFCEDFGASFDLPSGRYSADVTLLDFDGFAVSDTVVVGVRVVRDTEVRVDIDFPDSSIF